MVLEEHSHGGLCQVVQTRQSSYVVTKEVRGVPLWCGVVEVAWRGWVAWCGWGGVVGVVGWRGVVGVA